jgi:hypothetical protein
MSYKQFIAELEDDILPGEAERRYFRFFHSTRMLFCSVICVELSQVCTSRLYFPFLCISFGCQITVCMCSLSLLLGLQFLTVKTAPVSHIVEASVSYSYLILHKIFVSYAFAC